MKNYPEKTAKEIEKIASEAMDSAQQKIDQLNSLGSYARNKSSENLLSWQKWLGTIAFSMAAIGSAILVQNDQVHVHALISLVIFLAVGLWVILEHKKQFEKSASLSSADVDEFRPIYDDKKKAAFELWEDPSSIERHRFFLEQELRVMRKTKQLTKIQTEELKHGAIIYLNEIWLGLIILAIYLLFWPTLPQLALSYGLSSIYVIFLYIDTLLILLLFIFRDTQTSKKYINLANKSKKLKIKSEHKHTNEYTQRIQKEINKLNGLLNEDVN